MKNDLLHAELTQQVLGCAIDVHRQLGPGLLETSYKACLKEELTARGLASRDEVEIPIRYKERELEAGYRADPDQLQRADVEGRDTPPGRVVEDRTTSTTPILPCSRHGVAYNGTAPTCTRTLDGFLGVPPCFWP